MFSKLVIGIETSNIVCSIAWWQQDKILLEYNIESPNNHATILPKLFIEGLNILRCDPNDIGLICVTSGPGSFTGLRIGMSYGKGICYGLQKPIVSVSNFELLAIQAPKNTLPIYTLIDARHNRAYIGKFENDCYTISFKSIIQESQFDEAFVGDCFIIVHEKYKLDKMLREKFKDKMAVGKFDMKLLCQLGYQKFMNGKRDDLTKLEPLYLQTFAGIE